MQNVRNSIATVTATTVLVGLCAFLGTGTAAAAQSGSVLVAPAVGIAAGTVDGVNDESWH